jgi:rhamnosyltransferase
MGWHNEKYFVDCVDYEFCLRSQDAGLKIGVYKCTPGFDHVSEQADKRYRLFGKLYSFRAYPMFRIKDTCSASVKLIAKAFFLGRFKFAVKLSRLLCIYISFQIAARVLQPESNDKEIT